MGSVGKDSCCTFADNIIYVQIYFLTIATTLGAGVLGLPVTLARSGLSPAILTLSTTLIIEVMVVYLFTEVLQKCIAYQLRAACSDSQGVTPGAVPQSKKKGSGYDSDEELSEREKIFKATDDIMSEATEVRSTDIHLIGELLLPGFMRYVVDVFCVLLFTLQLTTYSLAGSEAFGDILHIRPIHVIPVFCWLLNLLILFGQRLILPLVSVMTFLKASLLICTVVIAFIVGSFIHGATHNDFSYTGRPFLLSTIALGGFPSVMPYLFSKIRYDERAVQGYRFSIILGVLTCYALNLLWCWSVLDVVPQTGTCLVLKNSSTAGVCIPSNVSLLQANINGEIATIPFKQMIYSQFPQYSWVALLVTIFIIVSITVSYIVISTVLCHTVDGFILSDLHTDKLRCCDVNKYINTQNVIALLANLVLLSIVFTIAMNNPRNFLKILEKGVSLLTNLFACFVCFTAWRVTSQRYSLHHLIVPLPLSNPQRILVYPAFLYFGFAIGYDVVGTVLEIMGYIRP